MLVENEIARLASEKMRPWFLILLGGASLLSRISWLIGTLISKLDNTTVFCVW